MTDAAPSYPDIDVEDPDIRRRVETLEEGHEEIRGEVKELRAAQGSLRLWLEEKLFVEIGQFRTEFNDAMGNKPSDLPKKAGSGILGTLFDLVNSMSKVKAQLKSLEAKKLPSKPPDDWGDSTTRFYIDQTAMEIENLKTAKAEAESKLKEKTNGQAKLLAEDRKFKLELWKIILGVIGTGGGAIALERAARAIIEAMGG